jgi:hypothetical protein
MPIVDRSSLTDLKINYQNHFEFICKTFLRNKGHASTYYININNFSRLYNLSDVALLIVCICSLDIYTKMLFELSIKLLIYSLNMIEYMGKLFRSTKVYHEYTSWYLFYQRDMNLLKRRSHLNEHIKTDRNKDSTKNAKNDKIENFADSVWVCS